jgi:hypothetical protein
LGFIEDFNVILKRTQSGVHYAHAATGELHLRPIIDLKPKEGQRFSEPLLLILLIWLKI